MTTMPGFTAEASIGAAQTRSRRAGPRGHGVRAITAQQSLRAPEGGTLEPATTCTCPCCQTVAGKLVCC